MKRNLNLDGQHYTNKNCGGGWGLAGGLWSLPGGDGWHTTVLVGLHPPPPLGLNLSGNQDGQHSTVRQVAGRNQKCQSRWTTHHG